MVPRGTDDRRVLDRVLELADVAGPPVLRERLHRVVGEAGEGLRPSAARTRRGSSARGAGRPRGGHAAAGPRSPSRSGGSTGPAGTSPPRTPPSGCGWSQARMRTCASRSLQRRPRDGTSAPAARAAASPAASSPSRRSRRGTASRRRPPAKQPVLAVGRAGERARLVAEQLGLEQALGQRGAVDRDERPVAARRRARGCSARPAPCRSRSRRRSARSCRGGRDLLDPPSSTSRMAPPTPDDLGRGQLPHATAEAIHLFPQLPRLDAAPDQREQAVGVKGFSMTSTAPRLTASTASATVP